MRAFFKKIRVNPFALAVILISLLVTYWLTQPAPVNQFRLSDGYLPVNDMDYKGHNEYRLNGKAVGSNPLELFSAGSFLSNNSKNADELFEDAHLDASPPIITDYRWNFDEEGPLVKDGESSFSDDPTTVKERAIYTIYHRLARHQPVNILIGSQFSVNGDSGAVLRGLPTNVTEFYNPFLYLERKDGIITAVLVTVNSYPSHDSVYRFMPLPVDTEYATAATGDFLTEWNKVWAWSAREISDCEVTVVLPGCLYVDQEARVRNLEKFVYTAPINVVEGNEQSSERGDRNVFTYYTTSVRNGKQIRVGMRIMPGLYGIDGAELQAQKRFVPYDHTAFADLPVLTP